MNYLESRIVDNYHRVCDQIEAACRRSGRDPNEVQLVAVTKYAELDWLEVLVANGVIDLGESRPQQLVQRVPLLPQQIHWHLIGHLQRNKVRSVLPLTTLIHSVDTAKLLERIDLLGQELNLVPRVLLQVNISAEATKDGFTSEKLISCWESIVNLAHVHVDGLMTMAPYNERSEKVRSIFQGLADLRATLLDMSPKPTRLTHLSMGMSRDFEVAIEAGATLVRVGRSLFEGLKSSK